MRISIAACPGKDRAAGSATAPEEPLHEVRATVSGPGTTHRLLREHTTELPGPTRTRLEEWYDAAVEGAPCLRHTE